MRYELICLRMTRLLIELVIACPDEYKMLVVMLRIVDDIQGSFVELCNFSQL